MIRRLGPAFALVAVVLTGCTADSEVASTDATREAETQPPSTAPDDERAAPDDENAEPADALAFDETVDDGVVEFIATVDELLAETEYATTAIEDPDVFVSTGLLFCGQLDQGTKPTEILTSYVEALTGDAIDKSDNDSLTLAGALLGSAVGHLCPEHTTRVEQGI